MFGSKPVRALVNVPVPEPSVVLESETVGLAVVLQHTPRLVTATPPSDVTFPPLSALVPAIEDTAVVVTVGEKDRVVKDRSLP